MEKPSRSTRHGCRENRTNCPGDRFRVPASSPTTRKSSPSANEKQSRPHWQNVTVEFQARTAQPPSSEFPTKPLPQRSRASALTSVSSKCTLRSKHPPRPRIGSCIQHNLPPLESLLWES